MSDGPDEVAVRKIAEMEVVTMTDAKNRLLNEHAASFRWLLASLFAANGGALVALGGNESLTVDGKLWAGALFTLGVLSSLITAWTNQRSARAIIEPVSSLIALWTCVAAGMPFEEEKHRDLLAEVDKGSRSSRPTQVFGWGSALLFLAGMVVAGVAMHAQGCSIAPSASTEVSKN